MPRTKVDTIRYTINHFNDFIRGELRRQKKRQKDLAEYLGISTATLSQKLNSEVEWSLKQFLKVCEFFGKEIEEVIG